MNNRQQGHAHLAVAIMCLLSLAAGFLFNKSHANYLPMRSQLTMDNTTFIDTPKYQYFYKAYADIYQWERAKDTLDFLLQDFGKSLSVDQSALYKSMFIRQINKIVFQVDSIKIPQPKNK
jgi:hypothetical protein